MFNKEISVHTHTLAYVLEKRWMNCGQISTSLEEAKLIVLLQFGGKHQELQRALTKLANKVYAKKCLLERMHLNYSYAVQDPRTNASVSEKGLDSVTNSSVKPADERATKKDNRILNA